MNTLSYKTISANKETAKKEWVVIDATDQVVGRLCSKVAKLIRGKYKPNFTPHVDCGDNVIIINAAKAVFTGKKETDKVYTRYTGYPGGQRFNTPAELRKRPDGMDKIIRHAVKGMLPKVVACSTTSISMMAQSTSTRLSSRRLSILTSINKA